MRHNPKTYIIQNLSKFSIRRERIRQNAGAMNSLNDNGLIKWFYEHALDQVSADGTQSMR